MKAKFTIDEIKTRLVHYQPKSPPPPIGKRAASILIPFYSTPQGLSLVFMKRTEDPGPHGGQISFPGGSKDVTDRDDEFTAIRETEEEFGVERQKIQIWGGLNSLATGGSNFWITPFIGSIATPCRFNPNPAEVERLIIIPFSHLLNSSNFTIGPYRWRNFTIISPLYTYHEDIIWGLTARIIQNLISLLRTGNES